ncbi:MAG: hypothetical protein F6K14_04735 [Symploca sp. SIO2C1]|nr:hypothetical protein [Symploca sp. SIO2C1]
MLTNKSLPVCLSLVSTDLPIWSTVETAATLYQKDQERFHLILREPVIPDWEPEPTAISYHYQQPNPQAIRLLWLEISPYRVTMTMQESKKLSYRHFWEQGVYGFNRYWLQSNQLQEHKSFCLRNYTRNLRLEGRPLPHSLRLEYELWSNQLQLGQYILHLEIEH